MFAIVRTGGKQYRVAAGDKIVVEKIGGDAGDTIQLGDILLAGEGADLRSVEGLMVSAEIIAQAKADKVIVFKKKRRHNYRRKNGHRQQHTILRITAIGDQKAEKKAAPKKEAAPADAEAAPKTAVTAEAAPKPVASKAAKPEPAAKPDTSEAKASPKAEAKEPVKKAATKKASTKKASTKKPGADKDA